MSSIFRFGSKLSHVTKAARLISTPALNGYSAVNTIASQKYANPGSAPYAGPLSRYSSLAAAGGGLVDDEDHLSLQEKWRQKEVAYKDQLFKAGKLNALWVLYMYEEQRVPHKMHANGTLYADWHSLRPDDVDFHFFRDVEQKCGILADDFLNFVAHLRFKLQSSGIHQGKYSPEVHLFMPPLANTEVNFLTYLCNLQDLSYHVIDDHPYPAGFLREEKEKYVKKFGHD